jgi:MarR family transcriptional regulator, organic hydroperoxide resistance regulator
VPTTTAADPVAFSAALDDFLRAVRSARGRLGADAELTLSQLHLLEPLVGAAAPLAMGALATAAGVSAPTATRMLAGLEQAGLVERRRDATDRRCVHVSLTEAGLDRVERKRERIGRRRRELFEALSPSERREAARLLSSLAAAMEELR